MTKRQDYQCPNHHGLLRPPTDRSRCQQFEAMDRQRDINKAISGVSKYILLIGPRTWRTLPSTHRQYLVPPAALPSVLNQSNIQDRILVAAHTSAWEIHSFPIQSRLATRLASERNPRLPSEQYRGSLEENQRREE
ncbi:hypothetical protein FRB90_001806, partial [Tulasnella sp. 427]